MKSLYTQTANTFLMIEPVVFGFNEQTAVNNFFQQKDTMNSAEIQLKALHEFTGMVKTLQNKGLQIIVVKDTPEPHTPDSIFPNNWISFLPDGKVVLYPMFALNRRNERRTEIFGIIEKCGYKVKEIVDLSHYEKDNKFLEGTGSMIFDHPNKIAYAALSERTHKAVFLEFCQQFDFTPIYFEAFQTVNHKRLPIYHTNVMMCIGNSYAVICLSSIDNNIQRQDIINNLSQLGKEIIEISEEQMHCFAGNMLQVQNTQGEPFLVMSQSAYNSLHPEQIKRIETYNSIIPVDISTIEKYGGGSARCMMAEVFIE